MTRLSPLQAMLLAFAGPASAGTPQTWPLPVDTGAQPSLSRGHDGGLNLSWIERSGDGHRLRFARFSGGRWSATRTIAEGRGWFVNWADFPSTTQLPDGSLWAHTLVKRGAGTYAYDVLLYRSADAGRTWSKPIRAHEDGTETEHGFATLWPWSKTELAIAWLDGRQTAGHGSHAGHGDGGGAMMSLRAATFDGQGRKTREWPLDTGTCDCCQTDSALTGDGPILVYRDRSAGEIRDIYSTRFDGHVWRSPQPVARDGWLMPACPVNGPAVAAAGKSVWAAWYTGAGNVPTLRVAYSGNGGAAFETARSIKQGPEIQGRVDLAADTDGAWLLWTEETQNQTLWLGRLDKTLKTAQAPRPIAILQGRGKATGFARMQSVGRELFVVYTDIVDGKPRLRGLRLSR